MPRREGGAWRQVRNGSSLLRESGVSEQGPLRSRDLIFGDEAKKEVEGHESQT